MNRAKMFFKKFFLLNDTPHAIAAGAALGIFFGIAPGEGVATTLIVASLFRWNRLAATAGVLAVNMWTTVLALPAAAYVGGVLFGNDGTLLQEEFMRLHDSGWTLVSGKIFFADIALPLFVGFVCVAGIVALLSYAVIYGAVRFHRRAGERTEESLER